MREFNWAVYDRWLTTTPEDRAHKEECNCEGCHKGHIESGSVAENAESPDFGCCKDQIELDIEKGKRCRLHPTAYFEPGYCEGAEDCPENKKEKSNG